MKNVFFTSLCALGLVACGGGSDRAAKRAILDSCTEEGIADANTCDCVADQMVETLDRDMLDIIVAAKESDDEATYLATEMQKLDREALGQFTLAAMSAATECAVEIEGREP
nr:hypothetical protein [Hyphomonas sp. Mor2]